MIEKRAIPECFNSENKRKTPEIYMVYHNFMIDNYRVNSTEYFTSAVCRRNLAGDVYQWGLINYQICVEFRPTPMGPPPISNFYIVPDTSHECRGELLGKAPVTLKVQSVENGTNTSNQFGLKLEQYIQLHKNDWNKVCEHVGTRTRDECILHILCLPIVDSYLEDDGGFRGPLGCQRVPPQQYPAVFEVFDLIEISTELHPNMKINLKY
uniref:Uncharacterized protein n=1 Tax=Glossina palpalis gambiensis TaxID=67801 RepID=A0A1B0C2Y2_9MUSC